MLRRAYLAVLRRLPRRHAKRVQRLVMLMRPRARRRAALEAARTPEVRLMCVAWGVDHDELASIRDRLLAVDAAHPERMLVVSDCDVIFGKGSCHFEYVPRREEWERVVPGGDYDDFVFRRVKEIADAFRARRVLALGTLDDTLLHAIARKRPERAQ